MPQTITLGANNAGGELTAAQFAEVLVFNRAISDTEHREIVGYLATKYNVNAKHDPLPERTLAIATTHRTRSLDGAGKRDLEPG